MIILLERKYSDVVGLGLSSCQKLLVRLGIFYRTVKDVISLSFHLALIKLSISFLSVFSLFSLNLYLEINERKK